MPKKLILLTCFLSCFLLQTYAIQVKGYIVTLKADTIYGWVQVSRFARFGGYLFKGIDENPLHEQVDFIAQNETKVKIYEPTMLLGFGFVYKSEKYVFKQVAVKRKSIFKGEQIQYRFARLLGEAPGVTEYKDYRAIPNPVRNKPTYLEHNIYLFRVKTDSVKQIESSDSLKTLKKD